MRIIKLLKITLSLFSLSLTSLLYFNQPIYANAEFLPTTQPTSIIFTPNNSSIEMLKNGYYIETVISSDTLLSENVFNISRFYTSKTITKTKTTYYKNSSGSILWSVSIKATFSYNGRSSKCTSCSHSTTAPGKSWSISSCTSSKSGNQATAKAVATQTGTDGTKYNITKSVTISCDANGNIT